MVDTEDAEENPVVGEVILKAALPFQHQRQNVNRVPTSMRRGGAADVG